MKKILSVIMSVCVLLGFGRINTKAVEGNCNILIVGKKGVGKSVLMHRFLTRNFDRPISDEEVLDEDGKPYEHEKVYYDPLDASISVVEADIERTKDLQYYCQNAHVIIHMSDLTGDNEQIPTTEELRDWYTEFVKTVLEQDNLYGEPGKGRILAKDPNFVARKITDGNIESDWWNLVELHDSYSGGTRKMGYIFFVFNKIDRSNRRIDPDYSYDEFVEQREYVSKMDNARSILSMNLKDSDSKTKLLCEQVWKIYKMCNFDIFREPIVKEKSIVETDSKSPIEPIEEGNTSVTSGDGKKILTPPTHVQQEDLIQRNQNITNNHSKAYNFKKVCLYATGACIILGTVYGIYKGAKKLCNNIISKFK